MTKVVGRGTLEVRLQDINQQIGTAVAASGEEVLNRARDLAPKRTGRLANELYLSQVIELGEGLWRIEIVAPTPYAAAQERGSGVHAERRPGITPHMIEVNPKDKKVLHFMWKGAPVSLIRGSGGAVFLPGTLTQGVVPTRFLRRALKESSKSTWSRIRKSVR